MNPAEFIRFVGQSRPQMTLKARIWQQHIRTTVFCITFEIVLYKMFVLSGPTELNGL